MPRMAWLSSVGVAFFAFAYPSIVQARPLDRQEQALVRRVNDSFAAQIAFLEKLVNINSETMNFEGVAAVGDILAKRLADLGFTVQWLDLRASDNRAGHLIATRAGRSGKHLLLIGHIDTVHAAGSGFNQFKREGDRATGPGTEDMKNGAAVLLYALQALEAEGALKDSMITVILTGDEEMPADNLAATRKPMIEAAKLADVVLSFEPGEPGVAVTSRRGFNAWRLDVGGKSAHSSLIFNGETGPGAIFEASRILNGFYEEVRGERLLTFNAGAIVGGTDASFDLNSSRGTAFGKNNVVPSSVVVAGEIRATSAEQLDRAKERMRKIVAAHLPKTSANLTFFDGYPPMFPKAGSNDLLRELSGISVALGAGPMAANDPATRGAGDISFVAPIVPAALDGLGGAGGGAHTTGEYVNLNSFRTSTQRAAILIRRLISDKQPANSNRRLTP